ncbi:hypothetical protein [Streptomyces sp. NPDC059874]|uniref:hypothetical protein n=1 Tax=Streptomyces sp. NPDC059874 TaxID=3346983 RepID=UPI00365A7F21
MSAKVEPRPETTRGVLLKDAARPEMQALLKVLEGAGLDLAVMGDGSQAVSAGYLVRPVGGTTVGAFVDWLNQGSQLGQRSNEEQERMRVAALVLRRGKWQLLPGTWHGLHVGPPGGSWWPVPDEDRARLSLAEAQEFVTQTYPGCSDLQAEQDDEGHVIGFTFVVPVNNRSEFGWIVAKTRHSGYTETHRETARRALRAVNRMPL